MDRVIVYPGQIPLETDVLRTNKFGMLAVAKLAAAMLGTSTVVNGLACVPTSPASLQVNVNPGEMYSLVNVDATAYSSVAADTTHSILKQGISLDAVTLSCPAPATGGQSINYLIQAAYQDTDTDNVALPYYNASNPSQAWSGPANSGTPQSTTRKGAISISAKAGTAATTGSQTTPAPDSGYTGLWVVTVANGQSTITASNITQATNAPILPSDLLHAIQQSSLTVASDTGSANTYVVSYSPAVTTLVDGMVLWFKAKTANTGASTLNVNGLGAMPLVGGAHAALQSGEIVANGKCQVVYRADITSFVLIECTGGAVQVAPATQSQHAAQFGQLPAVAGNMRSGRMSITTASATATFAADEVVVESALGGLPYRLANFSKTINLATTGAGGMDTGSAPTNGYVALFAIYNPTTQASALLAQNATTGGVAQVYNGANMPVGYTASALVCVWPTDGTGKLKPGIQRDRMISFPIVQVLSTVTTQASPTSLNISGAVPPNAVSVSGEMSVSNTSTIQQTLNVGGDQNMSGLNAVTGQANAGSSGIAANFNVIMAAAQTIWYTSASGGGTSNYIIYVSGYSF
ncbi:hypothetical protein V8918_03010 [Ralstonia mannitolilytica]|uniref:hypothetical protein n=1 Tax=Ralstonia mannitolilytica TaxID=105219 RepID=UPI003B844EEE